MKDGTNDFLLTTATATVAIDLVTDFGSPQGVTFVYADVDTAISAVLTHSDDGVNFVSTLDVDTNRLKEKLGYVGGKDFVKSDTNASVVFNHLSRKPTNGVPVLLTAELTNATTLVVTYDDVVFDRGGNTLVKYLLTGDAVVVLESFSISGKVMTFVVSGGPANGESYTLEGVGSAVESNNSIRDYSNTVVVTNSIV